MIADVTGRASNTTEGAAGSRVNAVVAFRVEWYAQLSPALTPSITRWRNSKTLQTWQVTGTKRRGSPVD
eukprot:43988-Eustigmatos_ZCMA.PRE.1